MNRLLAIVRHLVVAPDAYERPRLAILTIALVVAIGTVDFLLGYEISMQVFYCLPVVLGVIALGWRFGVVVASASVASWVIGDIAAGASYGHRLIPWWNAAIALSTYLLIIALFHFVQTLQREMEARVRDRTAELRAEIAERERLERAVLEIGERERRSIGHDLHDGLGQHLTGTAFAGQVLCEKLQARALSEEESDAWKVVQLVEEGIEKTRRLAKGLLLAEIQRDGLVTALEEFVTDATAQFRVTCTLETKGDCTVAESGAATHLLRIAQEAVRNAIRHGGAREIRVSLIDTPAMLQLDIRDNGRGILPPEHRGDGLGLRIMAHRAQIIGGEFSIVAPEDGGTLVRCRLPRQPSL